MIFSLIVAVTGSVRLTRDRFFARISHNGTTGQAEKEPQRSHDKAPAIAASPESKPQTGTALVQSAVETDEQQNDVCNCT